MFDYCCSLEALAASADFDITKGRDSWSCILPGIVQYLDWRFEMDDNKEQFKQWYLMLNLSNYHNIKHTGVVRCQPIDAVSKFLFKHMNAGITSHVLSYFGKKRGYGDLRGAFKERLLEVSLALRALRKENN